MTIPLTLGPARPVPLSSINPVAQLGAIYLGSAIVLGAVYTAMAVQLRNDASPKLAMRLFGYSITYITLLFGAMALDTLVRHA